MKYQLKVLLASTRPGRKGPAIARWLLDILKGNSNFDVELLDLKEVDLPFLDEEAHPRLKNYEKDHTIKWSKTIDSADAFIVITPEYNHGPPATIVNALDFLHNEWKEKPMGFVSYGGVSAGTRSVVRLIPTITALGMMPIPQAVNVPFFTQFIDENGEFHGNEKLNKSVRTMVSELNRWTGALNSMRRIVENV